MSGLKGSWLPSLEPSWGHRVSRSLQQPLQCCHIHVQHTGGHIALTHTDEEQDCSERCPQRFLRDFLLWSMGVCLFWAPVRSWAWERSFVFGPDNSALQTLNLNAECVCVYGRGREREHETLFFVREHHVAAWPRVGLYCPEIPSCLWFQRFSVFHHTFPRNCSFLCWLGIQDTVMTVQ